MRLNLTRLVLSTFAAIAVTATHATLSADAIRLKPSEDERHAINGTDKKPPNRGKHLGWDAKGRERRSNPTRIVAVDD